MGKDDLIPITSTQQAKEMGSKGGKVRSPRKKYAARLRELKKKGLTDSTVKKLTDIMEDPECSVLDIKLFMDSIKADDKLTPTERIRLSNAYVKLHQAHHGLKIKGEMKHEIKAAVINIINPGK